MKARGERQRVPHGFRHPWRSLKHWLQAVPVDDPVEWRNAPMLQILLLIFGVFFPLLVIPHWLEHADSPLDLPVEIRNGISIIMFWVCFWLVRRGRFRLSATIFISMALVLMAFSYQHHGLKAELAVQVTQVFPIVLGSVLLGRRALWAIVVTLLCTLALGGAVDAMRGPDNRGTDVSTAIINVVRCGLGFLIVGLILDRAISALRETLILANRRGDDLQHIQQVLRKEIAEKEASRAQLIQSQKVEALGRVSSGLAHDFNNILGVIMGFAGRQDAITSHTSAIDALDGIKLAAQRGGMAIRHVLGLAHGGAEMAIIDIRTVVNDMVPLMRQIFGNRIRIETTMQDTKALVVVNRSECELTLLNIASNARDAMPDGGTFSISITADSSRVTLTLADTGLGMSSETKARLFDLFYTTKRDGRGSGIGLATVKRFVEMSGGTIQIASEPLQGTSVSMRFPVAGIDRPAPQPASIHGLRLLLVEDDETLRNLLAEALRTAGAHVLEAGNGKQAVSQSVNAEPLDVVISDYHLPDTLGTEILEVIAELHPTASSLVISAYDPPLADRDDSGIPLQWLTKPFAPARLIEVVGAMRK